MGVCLRNIAPNIVICLQFMVTSKLMKKRLSDVMVSVRPLKCGRSWVRGPLGSISICCFFTDHATLEIKEYEQRLVGSESK